MSGLIDCTVYDRSLTQQMVRSVKLNYSMQYILIY